MSNGPEGLYADHANMRVMLELLQAELARYRAKGVADFELLQSMMDDIVLFQNLLHHPKEDLVFARLIKRDPANAEAILSLLTDHAKLAVLTHRFMAALRDVAASVELPRGWFDQLLSDYVLAVQVHMEMEEKEFFPKAVEKLTDVDWREVDGLVEKIKGPRITKVLAEVQRWLGREPPD